MKKRTDLIGRIRPFLKGNFVNRLKRCVVYISYDYIIEEKASTYISIRISENSLSVALIFF